MNSELKGPFQRNTICMRVRLWFYGIVSYRVVQSTNDIAVIDYEEQCTIESYTSAVSFATIYSEYIFSLFCITATNECMGCMCVWVRAKVRKVTITTIKFAPYHFPFALFGEVHSQRPDYKRFVIDTHMYIYAYAHTHTHADRTIEWSECNTATSIWFRFFL